MLGAQAALSHLLVQWRLITVLADRLYCNHHTHFTEGKAEVPSSAWLGGQVEEREGEVCGWMGVATPAAA